MFFHLSPVPASCRPVGGGCSSNVRRQSAPSPSTPTASAPRPARAPPPARPQAPEQPAARPGRQSQSPSPRHSPSSRLWQPCSRSPRPPPCRTPPLRTRSHQVWSTQQHKLVVRDSPGANFVCSCCACASKAHTGDGSDLSGAFALRQ